MKKIFYIGLLIGLYSCGPRTYSYKFSMTESQKPDKLSYENDTMLVAFNVFSKGIRMDITNKSDSVIKINWNEIELFENGSKRGIAHMKFDKGNFRSFQPPMVIAAKSKFSDLIIPQRNIYQYGKPGRESKRVVDAYPAKSDNSMKYSVEMLKGQRITLSLPIEIGNVSFTRSFNILLEDVKSNRSVSVGKVIGYTFLVPVYMLGGF